MRSDNLVELCKHEFAELIDDLFQMNRDNGHEFLRTPITNRLYSTWDDDYIFKLKRNIYTALAARKWFREHGPSWAPLLPLTFADIDKLKRDESGRINLVGLYASSLSLLEYDYKTHPPFDAYARGLMAYAHTPSSFRDDPELWHSFHQSRSRGSMQGLTGKRQK